MAESSQYTARRQGHTLRGSGSQPLPTRGYFRSYPRRHGQSSRQGLAMTAVKTASPYTARLAPPSTNTNASHRAHAQSIVAHPRSALFGPGAPGFAVTKTTYPSSLRRPTISAAPAGKHKQRTKKPGDDLSLGPAHPTLMPRARTPPGGHYYERDGVLYPIDVEFIDSPADPDMCVLMPPARCSTFRFSLT